MRIVASRRGILGSALLVGGLLAGCGDGSATDPDAIVVGFSQIGAESA